MAVVMTLLPLTMPAVNAIIHTAYYNSATIGTDTLGGVTYATVHYEGLYNGGVPGTPSLPVDYIRFSVPYNATNFTVTAQPKNTYSLGLNYPVYPCQEPRMMSDTTPVVITLPDSAAYYSGSDYPTQRAWVVDEGFLAGENHIVTVAVMPFAYRYSASGPYRHTLKQSDSIRLVLSYDLGDSLSTFPIVRDNATLREEAYELVQTFVVNPNAVTDNAPSVSVCSDIQGDFDYLVVTTPALKHSIRRLAALNRQKGHKVKIVTIDEVMNDSIASCGDISNSQILYTDSAGVLRQYLRNNYINNGLKNVLLVGNIPYRIIYTKYGRDLLTDWYYCDLNSEFTDFKHDKEPELYVGRIIAKTDKQIENYTNKLLMYEFNPGNGDYSYLRWAFYSNGRDFRKYLNRTINILDPIFPNRIVINDTVGNNSRYPRGHHFIDSIRNCRVSFMSIFNHGDITRTKTYGPDSLKLEYFIKTVSTESSGNGLNRLLNKYYPIIFYSPSCETIPFDNTTTSLGEEFTTGKDYGGPVYMGFTRPVFATESKIMEEQFAKQIAQNKEFQLGAAYAISNGLSAPNCQYDTYIHCYIGDPVIELWTSEPYDYLGINCSRYENSVVVSGIQADSTIVAYYHNDYSQGIYVVSDSIFSLNGISPNSIITLYKHNYLPYILPIELQNFTILNSQYVYAKDFIAGSSIDNNRTNGEVIVSEGVEYEIEASGKVTLEDGFKVEKGATFAVYRSSFR